MSEKTVVLNKDLNIIEQRALSTLDPLGALTIDMCEAIRRGSAKLIFADERAVLIRHNCGVIMLWCEDTAAGESAINIIERDESGKPNVRLIVAHGDAAAEAVRNRLGFELGEPCIQFCRFSKEKLPMRYEECIRKLDLSDLAEVNAHYGIHGDHNERMIRAGLVYGLELDGALAGFIGMHPEGSVGMMEVFPEFRRRGLGTELESFMHNMHIDRGWIPYGQVYVSNEASLTMQAKFGLSRSEGCIRWAFPPRDGDDAREND